MSSFNSESGTCCDVSHISLELIPFTINDGCASIKRFALHTFKCLDILDS